MTFLQLNIKEEQIKATDKSVLVTAVLMAKLAQKRGQNIISVFKECFGGR